jgi:hypothetical protein
MNNALLNEAVLAGYTNPESALEFNSVRHVVKDLL